MTIWERTIAGQPLHDWVEALAIAGTAWLLGQLVYRLSRRWLFRHVKSTPNRIDDVILRTLQGPVVVMVTLVGFFVAFQRLSFAPAVERGILHAFKAAWTLTITWLLVRAISSLLREFLMPRAEKRGDAAMSESLLQLVMRSATVVVWGLGIVAALNNVGYDVSALIAGIGISGLALAMAAKDTVANLFGGVTVFADKPFSIGDRIRIGGHEGTVLTIGMRSTRLRTLDGPIVVIPNFKFTDTVLENVTAEQHRRIRLQLGLTYDTTPERMERALALLSELVHARQQALLPEHTAYFHTFGDWSLNIVFVYRIRHGQHIDRTQSEVNLEIMRRFAAEGLDFAFPTQVAINGDPPMPKN